MNLKKENKSLGIFSIIICVVSIFFYFIPYLDISAPFFALLGIIVSISALIENRSNIKLLSFVSFLVSLTIFIIFFIKIRSQYSIF
jgi:hypothetical protein